MSPWSPVPIRGTRFRRFSAIVEDGGAGLNVQMRTAAGELPRGTEIVLIERLAAANAWLVVSKDEFEGLDLPGAAGPRA